MPSTSLSIVESHPEVEQFLKEFQPELDHIIHTTPKSPNWLSKPVPQGYWNVMKNQRNFFEWIAIQHGFTTDQDWYQLTRNDVLSLGGGGLLKRYNGSLVKALQAIFPEKNWNTHLFKAVPQGYWNDVKNQRDFLDWVAFQRGFTTDQDWYQLTRNDVLSLGGGGLLNKYNNSISKALQTIYPEKQWNQYSFHLSQGYWDDLSNQRKFLEWVAAERGLTTYHDWHQLTCNEVRSLGGAGLLNKYNNSLSEALQTLFPDKQWNLYSFQAVPRDYWNDMKHQRDFLDWIAVQHGFTTHQDWYQLTSNDVRSLGGGGLLNTYSGSLIKALQTIFPEKNWLPFLFQRVPNGYWNSTSNVMQYMNWLTEQLGIRTMKDWENITSFDIVGHGGATLLEKFGGLLNLLKYCYPDYHWNQKTFSFLGSSKGQLLLLKNVQDIFREHNVQVFNDYSLEKLLPSGTNAPMELDIFIPQLKLAFEYQGEQHYSFHYLYGDPAKQQARDAEKKAKCLQAGITLIEVPYWWDRRLESLLATIHRIRPDIIPADRVPQEAVPIAAKVEKRKRPLVKQISSKADQI